MREHLYTPIWNKYLPIINVAVSSSAGRAVQLSSIEFTTAGDRKPSGYSFNLELVNGKVVNDISGSAVARDLEFVLTNDRAFKEKATNRHIKINLGSDFKLRIKSSPLS